MKVKKILTAVMCLCMTAQMSGYIQPTFNANANGNVVVEQPVKTEIYDIFQYKNLGRYIEITAISSMAEGVVEVPAEIDGLPVKVAGEHAFAGNEKITDIKLPDTLTSIGKGAFWGDIALTSVTIPDGITQIEDETFLNCMKLTNVFLPDTLKSIGVRAFYNCAMISVKVPENVKEIGSQAFDSCRQLRNVNIPDGVTVLEEGVFSSCDSLYSIELPESVEKICQLALPSGITQVTIHNPDCEFEAFSILGDRSKCTIIAKNDSKVHAQAVEYGFQFEMLSPPLGLVSMGDANGDGDFAISDVVTLQNYIMGKGEIENLSAVDFTDDGVIDVFDLCLMKQAIVAKTITPPAPAMSLNLTADIKSAEVDGKEADEAFVNGQTSFALELFKNTVKENENVLVSPYSVVQALAMTGNGADGITKEEMENVIGGGIDFDELNKYLYTQRTSQPNDEKCKLLTANSVWTRDDEARMQVSSEFLQKVVDYYSAEVFKAPFDDTTVNDINSWVDTNTDHMIDKVLDKINGDVVMYLINAVTFDAKWQTPYTDYGYSYKRDFTAYDGTIQTAEMMYSDEYYYLEDENAVGFMKYYEGGRYAFATLLPDEDITVVDYVNGLTSESLHNILANPQEETIDAGMPKFSYDYSTELKEVLSSMGMPTAFSPDADFSNMAKTATGQLFISRVLHNTFIEVNTEGTRAAAVTVVEASDGCIAMPVEKKEVILDRPFVYCIVDTETYLPVFMGTLMNLE